MKNSLKREVKGRELVTDVAQTWCPGCPDYMILESSRKAILSLMKQGHKRENFAMVSGIGCHGKIFDYLNLSGIYALHGRAIPTAMGMKIGNPNLKVIVFSGDGDSYSEGMEHFVHACRFNPNMVLIVNDNQSFSLTTGQATPTSQQGWKNKVQTLGEFNKPLNPLMIALSSGAGFVARCNAKDIEHSAKIIEEAIKYNGFAYVEMIQDCQIFNLDASKRDKMIYKIEDKKRSLKEAMEVAMEFDYNLKDGKLPIGIIYREERKTLEEEWPQLNNLIKNNVGWKDLRK